MSRRLVMAAGVLLLLVGGGTPVIALFFAALCGYWVGSLVRRPRA
jgi:hypothetical protein